MQRGFTSYSSPYNAAVLVVEEAINEAKDLGQPIALVTLDAEKTSGMGECFVNYIRQA